MASKEANTVLSIILPFRTIDNRRLAFWLPWCRSAAMGILSIATTNFRDELQFIPFIFALAGAVYSLGAVILSLEEWASKHKKEVW